MKKWSVSPELNILSTGEYNEAYNHPTFREEAAQVALSSNQPRKIIAADFGIGVSTLNRWISEYRNKQIPEPSDDVQKELARLRREVRDLREERDILKKAARYFASQKP